MLEVPDSPINGSPINDSAVGANAKSEEEKTREEKGAEKGRVGASLFDDDLPELAPLVQSALQYEQALSPPPSPSSPAPAARTRLGGAKKEPPKDKELSGLEEFESEFKLSPPEPAPRKKMTAGIENEDIANALDKLVLPGNALDVAGSPTPKEAEFGFPCKVCGTRMLAAVSKVGTNTRCPDCFSEFLIPPPPVKKKEPKRVTRQELAEVTFAPIDGKSSRDYRGGTQADQLLEKAEAELESEEKELQGLTSSFDSQRWFGLLFWFLKDPTMIFITILFSAICAIWIPMVTYAPEGLNVNEKVGSIVQAALFLIPAFFIFTALLALGMCILSTVANQYNRIQDWPFSRTGEVAGEVIMVLTAAAIAGAPGGMIGSGLASVTGSPVITACFSLISLWLLFPFVLLSMADNNAITEPFSKNVFESMKERVDAWGAMYLQTMLAMAALFVLIVWSLQEGLVGEFLFGLCMPFLVLFLFNQYGLLAGRISDVTGLGFSGDFSSEHTND